MNERANHLNIGVRYAKNAEKMKVFVQEIIDPELFTEQYLN